MTDLPIGLQSSYWGMIHSTFLFVNDTDYWSRSLSIVNSVKLDHLPTDQPMEKDSKNHLKVCQTAHQSNQLRQEKWDEKTILFDFFLNIYFCPKIFEILVFMLDPGPHEGFFFRFCYHFYFPHNYGCSRQYIEVAISNFLSELAKNQV